MKIVCINNQNELSEFTMDITVGRIYESLELDVKPYIGKSKDKYPYRIINDKMEDVVYWSDYFKPLIEVRNEKLEKILCE